MSIINYLPRLIDVYWDLACQHCRIPGARSEPFKLYLLLGELQDASLRPAYEKAVKNLRKLPVENELIFESEAADFTNRLAEQMEAHAGEEEVTGKAAAEEAVAEETLAADW